MEIITLPGINNNIYILGCFCLISSLKITKITHFYVVRIGCIRGNRFAMKDTTIGKFLVHSGIFGPDPGGKYMSFGVFDEK